MVTWLIYDISDDNTRNTISKICKRIGLYRVQESVFLGELESNRFDELILRCDELINPETDSIYLSPLCSDDYKKIKTLGKGFNKELVAATQKHFFF